MDILKPNLNLNIKMQVMHLSLTNPINLNSTVDSLINLNSTADSQPTTKDILKLTTSSKQETITRRFLLSKAPSLHLLLNTSRKKAFLARSKAFLTNIVITIPLINHELIKK